jgi:flagellum-specific peptidoglycan hydrolase FlgJ
MPQKFMHAKKHMPLVAAQTVYKIAAKSPTALFLAKAIPAAQKSEKETGVPASITIAQACVESGWGKLFFGPDVNNYFGIQAPVINGQHYVGKIATGWKTERTTEEVKGQREVEYEPFRTYKDMADSFSDHGAWLSVNSNFKPLFTAYQKTGDADNFARGLQSHGYATASGYAAALIKIMQQRNLYKYNAVKRDQGLIALTK